MAIDNKSNSVIMRAMNMKHLKNIAETSANEFKDSIEKEYEKSFEQIFEFIKYPGKNKIVVFDIETTGLHCGEGGKEDCRIIEIAAVKFEKDKPLEVFHSYISNPTHLKKEIVALTGITDKMLSDAPHIDQVLHKFSAFSEGCVLVSHNLFFACKFLDYYGEQCGVVFSKDRVDTVSLAKNILGENVENYRLSTVAKYFHITEKPITVMLYAETTAKILLEFARLQKDRLN